MCTGEGLWYHLFGNGDDAQIMYDNRQIFEYLKTFEEKKKAVQLSLFD